MLWEIGKIKKVLRLGKLRTRSFLRLKLGFLKKF